MENNKSFRLPKKFTEQWLEALKSGEYTQLSGSLILYRTEEGDYNEELGIFEDDVVLQCDTKQCCCLGVAAVMLGATAEEVGGHDMPNDMDTPVLTRINYPKELYEKDNTKSNKLEDILAQLNDGNFSYKNYEDYLREYPDLKFSIVPTKSTEENSYDPIKYSFEEIADFIKDNVELYEEDVRDEGI